MRPLASQGTTFSVIQSLTPSRIAAALLGHTASGSRLRYLVVGSIATPHTAVSRGCRFPKMTVGCCQSRAHLRPFMVLGAGAFHPGTCRYQLCSDRATPPLGIGMFGVSCVVDMGS